MVKHAYDKYQIDFIAFLDENLMTMDVSSGRTWMKEICRLWHEYGLVPEKRPDGSWTGVHWGGTSHATLCNPEILKIMREAGCSHLVYGYESFAQHVMKTIGKGATPTNNIRSFFWTLEAGIRPIPNQIIGFPNEDFESLRANMDAWEQLGIVVKPLFATPYPGSEWFTMYRSQILAAIRRRPRAVHPRSRRRIEIIGGHLAQLQRRRAARAARDDDEFQLAPARRI